jgi:hypothetical protein
MRRLLMVGAAAALACGDSTAPPSANWDGVWSVRTSVLDAGGPLEGSIEPTPFSLTITVNGNTISDTFPTLMWAHSGGAWTFSFGAPNNAIVAHADTLRWRIYSAPDTLGRTCTLVYSGVLVASDSAQGSVLVSGTSALCAAANGGTWAGKR